MLDINISVLIFISINYVNRLVIKKNMPGLKDLCH